MDSRGPARFVKVVLEVSTCHSSTNASTVWFLVGNGGMDPYSSPYIIPITQSHQRIVLLSYTDR